MAQGYFGKPGAPRPLGGPDLGDLALNALDLVSGGEGLGQAAPVTRDVARVPGAAQAGLGTVPGLDTSGSNGYGDIFPVAEPPYQRGGPTARPTSLPGTMIGRPAGTSASATPEPPQRSPIRAYKDAQGRTIFSNDGEGQSKLGNKETSYDLATAALRPEGRQAGGVSSPVARNDQGRTTMVPDPGLAFQRQQEIEDLGHAAIVQQLRDQANPQASIQRDLAAAQEISKQFTPEPANVEAYIAAQVKAYQAARPGVDPKAIEMLVRNDMQNKLQQAKQKAVEEHFNKLHYPGATLSGYGAELRGDAANLGSP